jgi:hypothetical protein
MRGCGDAAGFRYRRDDLRAAASASGGSRGDVGALGKGVRVGGCSWRERLELQSRYGVQY